MANRNQGKYFVGIDGGGSGTRGLAALGDGSGAIRSLAGPSNPNNSSIESAAAAIADCLDQLALGPDRVEGICAGIAGLANAELINAMRGELLRLRPGFRGTPIHMTHDLETAWQGAFGGEDGLCVIAGTGSACYARTRDGREIRVSGRANGRDDPGSGYSLAAIALRLGLVPGSLPESANRAAIAALVPQALAALVGAPDILRSEAGELATMASEALELFPRGSGPKFVLVGGVFTASELMKSLVSEAIVSRRPDALLCHPAQDALRGAFEIARQLGSSQ